MMRKSEELKQIAQLRQAVAPLVTLIKNDADKALIDRLERVENLITEIAKGIRVEAPPPQVTVNFDTDTVIKALEKQRQAIMAKNNPAPVQPAAYEPHDQAKAAPFNYAGFVNPDGAWYIQRVAKGEQRYAKGQGDYTDAWEKRNKLKYGYLDA